MRNYLKFTVSVIAYTQTFPGGFQNFLQTAILGEDDDDVVEKADGMMRYLQSLPAGATYEVTDYQNTVVYLDMDKKLVAQLFDDLWRVMFSNAALTTEKLLAYLTNSWDPDPAGPGTFNLSQASYPFVAKSPRKTWSHGH